MTSSLDAIGAIEYALNQEQTDLDTLASHLPDAIAVKFMRRNITVMMKWLQTAHSSGVVDADRRLLAVGRTGCVSAIHVLTQLRNITLRG